MSSEPPTSIYVLAGFVRVMSGISALLISPAAKRNTCCDRVLANAAARSSYSAILSTNDSTPRSGTVRTAAGQDGSASTSPSCSAAWMRALQSSTMGAPDCVSASSHSCAPP
eukprot:3410647-Rhodomonas_salina.5